jgi:hypothetical protein
MTDKKREKREIERERKREKNRERKTEREKKRERARERERERKRETMQLLHLFKKMNHARKYYFKKKFHVTEHLHSGNSMYNVIILVLNLFCIMTLSKHFQNFCDPEVLKTTTNLRL